MAWCQIQFHNKTIKTQILRTVTYALDETVHFPFNWNIYCICRTLLFSAMHIMEKLIETDALRGIGMSFDNPSPIYQLCTQHKFRSDAFWECFIRHFSLTVYHDSCTCRMGSFDDPTAVVDPQLR